MQHLQTAGSPRRRAWTFCLGMVCGGGAWATHFVAVLAYRPGLPVTYNPLLTLVSAVAGIALAWAAFAVVFRRKSRSGAVLAGLLFASSVASLHFLGMASVEAAARRVWAPDLLIASWLLCAAFAIAAMSLMTRARSHREHGRDRPPCWLPRWWCCISPPWAR